MVPKGLPSEFRVFFSAPEWLGTEFSAFSVPGNRRNSARKFIISDCPAVPRDIFFSETDNPKYLFYILKNPTYFILNIILSSF
jgi:hypothetical protein